MNLSASQTPSQFLPRHLGRVEGLHSDRAELAALPRKGAEAFTFNPAEQLLEALRRDGSERCFIALRAVLAKHHAVVLDHMGIPNIGSGHLVLKSVDAPRIAHFIESSI